MSTSSLRILLFLLALTPLGLSRAEAQSAPDCTTPRRAAVTFLANLPPNGRSPEKAIRCFDWDHAGTAAAERTTLALHLKQALDISGYWVKVDELPDEASPDGVERLPLADELPDIYLQKVGERWMISAPSIRAIPRVYAEHVNEAVERVIARLPAPLLLEPIYGVAWWQLAGLLLAVLLAFVARAFVSWLVAAQGRRLLRLRGAGADTGIVDKASRPLGTLAMAGVLYSVLPMLRFSARFNDIALVAIRVLAASAVVLLAYRLVDLASDVFAHRAAKTDTKLDDQVVPLVRKTLKVFVVGIGIIFILQNMDVDVGSLIAGASLGGLAFTLAARDTVANLFGSVSIFADQPFQVGDWVVIDGHEGIVEEVGMRSTRIRTFYSSVVSIPNSKVANASVDNYGLRLYRRSTFSVGLTYDTTPDQIQAFCEGARAVLSANPVVLQDTFEVHFRDFGDSGLQIFFYFFFDVADWSAELSARHNVLLEFMRLADSLGVRFAFPTQTLHVESMAAPEPAAVRSPKDR
ncbi:MAG: mechanosensitive ion channel, partial [Deltaproteobacteria bacterium]|nr:mechanosensitive ion channel [Deltaproteobacteria bacterium]